MKNVIPNFLGIGAKKSGTTWVAEVLRVHPDIFVAHGKELHYFTANFHKGLDWYLSNFKTVEKQKAIGEYSVSYMSDSKVVARRIYDLNPKIKIIVALRNPVDRAFSHYCWSMQKGKNFTTFVDSIKTNPSFISDGLYFQKMEPYWKIFSNDQIHFILYDDIKNNDIKVQKDLYRFLEVEECFDSGLGDTVVGKTITPRLRIAEGIRQKVFSLAMRNDIPFIITWAKKCGISRFYRSINDKATENNKLTEDDRKKVFAYFADDLEMFSDKAGIDLSSWYVKC